MKWITVLSFLLLIGACSTERTATDLSGERGAMAEIHGTSYLKNYTNAEGHSIREIHNHHIEEHTAMLTDVPNHLILESSITQKQFPNRDTCATGNLKLNFYKSLEDTLVLFRAYATAADHYEFISKSRDIFQTVIKPCGDYDKNGRLYSLYSPHPILTYHDRYNRITLPRTDIVRFAGFQPDQTFWRFNSKQVKNQLVGILYYGSRQKNLGQVRITTSNPQLYHKVRKHPPKLFILAERSGSTIRSRDMELYPDKGEDFYQVPTNFSFELNFTEVEGVDPIVIPVENDQLMLEEALSGPFQLKAL